MKIIGVMGPEKKKIMFFLYINTLIFQHTLILFFKDRNISNMSKHIDFSTLNLNLRFVSYIFSYFLYKFKMAAKIYLIVGAQTPKFIET